jgi:hypothetical protein
LAESYDIDFLCRKAGGFFIYASTVVKFVEYEHDPPTDRLTHIIELGRNTTEEGKSGVDPLYTQVLGQAFRDVKPDEQEELYSRFRLIVGAVLLVFHPLSMQTLSELVKNCGTPSLISSTLRPFHSLLLVPGNKADPIRVFHKSFPDFLTDRRKVRRRAVPRRPPVHHINILFSCLDMMKKLRKNICNLDGCPVLSEVKDLRRRREDHIGSALEYACQFWAKHLEKTPGEGDHVERVQKEVDEFFTTRLLFWIEVLSLMGNLDVGVHAIHDVDQWYQSVSCVGHLSRHMLMCVQAGLSCKWTNDSQRLIMLNFDEICRSPVQLYWCALPFCPSSSWLHESYPEESLQGVKVVKGRPENGEHVLAQSPWIDVDPLACYKDIVTVGLRVW